ncbi:MAG: DUF3990 domain-containing protein [Kiritimatiellia bacterium]
MVLYHGSNVEVMTPEIRPLVRALDFGQAFYLTSSEEQAVKWAKTSTLRRGAGVPTVSVFEIPEGRFDELTALKFPGPTSVWLRYVSRNRNQGVDDSDADVVIGPVANDNTMSVLNLYFKGAYTEEEALRRLLPQRLRDQFAFKTERSLVCLKFVESWEVS